MVDVLVELVDVEVLDVEDEVELVETDVLDVLVVIVVLEVELEVEDVDVVVEYSGSSLTVLANDQSSK